jgi:hypothetical protein
MHEGENDKNGVCAVGTYWLDLSNLKKPFVAKYLKSGSHAASSEILTGFV